MSAISTGLVIGDNLSTAWQNTVLAVGTSPQGKSFHTMTRVLDPGTQEDKIRAAADGLLARRNLRDLPGVETVANTIFPQALADTCTDHDELVARYARMYPRLRKYRANAAGTYFGRLVQYPGPEGPVDQLAKVMNAMRKQIDNTGPMSTGYETAIEAPSDPGPDSDPGDASCGDDGASTPDQDGEASSWATTFSPHHDRKIRAFPCMSFCSFQLDHGTVHAMAHYRYEYLIEKGYGNYLGLARLQAYLAAQLGLAVGVLTITTGRAWVTQPMSTVEKYLDGLPL